MLNLHQTWSLYNCTSKLRHCQAGFMKKWHLRDKKTVWPMLSLLMTFPDKSYFWTSVCGWSAMMPLVRQQFLFYFWVRLGAPTGFITLICLGGFFFTFCSTSHAGLIYMRDMISSHGDICFSISLCSNTSPAGLLRDSPQLLTIPVSAASKSGWFTSLEISGFLGTPSTFAMPCL